MRASDASWTASARLRRVNCLLQANLVEIKLAQLADAVGAKFNPNQPRVPAGNPDGGQWTGSGGGSAATGQAFGGSLVDQRQLAASDRQAECEIQYDLDIFQCAMVGLRACYAQAMVRLFACEKGHPIPPLNY